MRGGSWVVISRADRCLSGLYKGSIRARLGGSWLVISRAYKQDN